MRRSAPTQPGFRSPHTGELAELDELAEALRATGLGEVDGPTETPWFAVEVVGRDADGNTVVLTARAETAPPGAWVDEVRSSITEPAS